MPSILLDVAHAYLVDRGFSVSQTRDANGAWGDVTVVDHAHDRQCTLTHEEFVRAAKLGPDAMLRGLLDRLDLVGPAVPAAWEPSHREIL